MAISIFLVKPALLYSQPDENKMIGGELRLERLYFQKSPFGVRKDIDLGFALKYLQRLSPSSGSDSIPIKRNRIGPKLLSSYWCGVTIGFSGYYSNADSMNMNGTEVYVGPSLRYDATENLFLETTFSIQYQRYRTSTPDPISGNYWYVPATDLIGINCILGVGYSIKLNSNIYLEPLLGYQINWEWFYLNQNDNNYFPYEKRHGFIMCMCFLYFF
ncbi:MAG: hypothetical protein R6U52_05600 [Kosmotogaceae bacterium]